jgi:hypothetical protein
MIIQPPEWQHPVVYPVPETVCNVSSPQIDLGGVWSLAHNPEGSYWLRGEQQKITWADTVVPGDLSAARKRRGTWAKELLVYRREIDIPQDFAGKHILLRFEGSYGLTRVWADGQLVASHADGFITWYGDLTGFVTAGQPCLLTIAIENNNDDVSGFNQGGLVRGISLVALPDQHFTRLHVETRFDETCADATLSILLGVDGLTAACSAAAADTMTTDKTTVDSVGVLLELFDPDGAKILAHRQCLARVQDCIELPVAAPLKWDAEHPRLYTLRATLLTGDIPVETCSRAVGFREIRRTGNRLFVNGDEVKLRGVCRHDISPLNGRTLTDEELHADVRLFKEANINYIRTSHYPPSEAFLDLCDQVGMYVEDEVGLAFIGRSLKYTEKSPAHTERYLTFMSELIERDRSHPSVLIWSLANESFYGPNFAAINAWAHREDPSRPTKFSYPMTMQEEDEPVDIWSVHYPSFDSDLAKKHDNVSVGFLPGRDVPVLHDECTHIPCYNRSEHRRDPAVRVFWGESIRRFWDNIWRTPGALGGAIWAGIDEVSFAAPGRILEWGIIDVWRRPKPEYWMTRKAYSPVRLLQEAVPDPGQNPLKILAENRFCHTNLNELTIAWQAGSDEGTLHGPDALPGMTGSIWLPVRTWQPGDVVRLNFSDSYGQAIDEFEVMIAPQEHRLPAFCGRAPELAVLEKTIVVRGEGFEIVWDRTTGRIIAGKSQGKQLLTGGPDLHVFGVNLQPWSCIDFTAQIKDDLAELNCCGQYGTDGTVSFTIKIDADGLMQVETVLEEWQLEMPQSMKIRVGIHPGGLDEWGTAFTLDSQVDSVSWNRHSILSGWPDDHIGRRCGTAYRNSGGRDSAWAVKPELPWSLDAKSPILFGRHDPGLRGTNDFRAMKHHIYEATVTGPDGNGSVQIHSDGTHSLRFELAPDPDCLIDDRDPSIRYSGSWHVQHDPSHLGGSETVSFTAGDYAECNFEGTGIAWIGSADVTNGLARIWIDGVPQDDLISQRVTGPEFAGSSIGFDKKYGLIHYAVTDLAQGSHSLRIEVTGEKTPDASDCLIGIDCLRIIRTQPDAVKLMVIQDYNYPHLAWGNYIRPAVLIGTGSRATAWLRLTGHVKS